jgi:hypothetical protein
LVNRNKMIMEILTKGLNWAAGNIGWRLKRNHPTHFSFDFTSITAIILNWKI